ncbi:MAG: hypothetical protein HKN10_13170 [Myxococcales bacterium]|nr:hypothetical protein [Myxococcales bacterium]
MPKIDAVAQAEWRLLPFLSEMNDSDAYAVFVALHVPLLALVLWSTGSTVLRMRRRSQFLVDAFLVIHAGLHTALRSHDDYTFHTTLSEACIDGAAALGLIHTGLSIRPLPAPMSRIKSLTFVQYLVCKYQELCGDPAPKSKLPQSARSTS